MRKRESASCFANRRDGKSRQPVIRHGFCHIDVIVLAICILFTVSLLFLILPLNISNVAPSRNRLSPPALADAAAPSAPALTPYSAFQPRFTPYSALNETEG